MRPPYVVPVFLQTLTALTDKYTHHEAKKREARALLAAVTPHDTQHALNRVLLRAAALSDDELSFLNEALWVFRFQTFLTTLDRQHAILDVLGERKNPLGEFRLALQTLVPSRNRVHADAAMLDVALRKRRYRSRDELTRPFGVAAEDVQAEIDRKKRARSARDDQ